MKYFICISIWVLGVLLALSLHYSFISNHTVNKTYPSATHFPQSKRNIDTYYKRTTDLFLHNLFVAFLISIGGIVTAGSLSIIVLFYNGFISTSVIINSYQQDTVYNMLSNLAHAPFEILALIWFGSIGLSGINLASKFIKQKQIKISDFYTLQNIWKPVLLLLVAALIEAR